MVEYILGIGHLTREDCRQVMSDVDRRIERLQMSVKYIRNELDHLMTIKFQVTQREKEIWKEHEENKSDVL